MGTKRLIILFGWSIGLFIIVQSLVYALSALIGIGGLFLAIVLGVILAGVAGYRAEKSILKNNLYAKKNSGLLVGFSVAVLYGFIAAVVNYFITGHFNFNSGGFGVLVACTIGGIIAEHTFQQT